MNMQMPFGLKIPVFYVNPPCNADSGIIEEVSHAGGLGIVDHVTAGPAAIRVNPGVPHGVRVHARDIRDLAVSPDIKLILIPLEDMSDPSALGPNSLKESPLPVVVEVGSAEDALKAEKAGAAALIARGNEGPGWVSETNGFVLVQKILAVCNLPLFLQGGVGLRTAAGAVAAGASGVVLDVHLLMTDGSAVPRPFQDFLGSLSLPTTVLLAEPWGNPLRVYCRVGTKIVKNLRKVEDTLVPDDFPSYRERLNAALRNPVTSADADEALLPLSEDIVTSRSLVERHRTAGAIVEEFGKRMSAARGAWPFGEDAPLCRDHGTRFPIVQGPMAHVSDNPAFLAAVAAGGALPFLAMGNMPGPIAEEGLQLAAEKTAGRFGVGLIGLEVNRKGYEKHLEIMKEAPPPFAILAAGGPDLARRIEEMGTACYLHCPSPGILKEGLKSGHRRFVFEGCESGGHIGILGSLNLWTANLHELDFAAKKGLDLSEVTVLFAGGIATGRASAFIAGMVADLPLLKVGLQMGTAYLGSEEATSTCAITPTYQRLTLETDRTVILGRTVNIRARGAGSPMAARLIEREQDRLRSSVPLQERKELYEKDNLGALRLASKGCAIDPETATWDCPVFCDLSPDEQLDRGLYLMGQVVCLMNGPTTVEEIHREIIDEGRRIFESTRPSVAAEPVVVEEGAVLEETLEAETEREPIAVVGLGLRLPGSDSPQSFWEQITTGRSGIGEVPGERWERLDFYYDPDPKAPDKTYSKIGGFVRDFVFDPLRYRIPPSVALLMDRSQQLAVACVADALEDAGLSPERLKGKKVGIILGNSMGGENTDRYAWRVALPRSVSILEEAFSRLDLDQEAKTKLLQEFRSQYLAGLPEITEDSLPGELANVISGRVANVFNLEGPNFTVDAACASSMAAVMNAIAGLREGRIDYAVTGGVDAAMHASSFVKFCKIGALSPDGSRPFDESANGFVMGEGAGIMILKRLSDAIRDGDRVYGTVLGVGSSSDGRGKGITAPNKAGQERAVKACLESAGVSVESIGLIEAHGTSTAVGDKTELSMLDAFFRAAGIPKGSVGIGSVKSQIGHLKAAAGAAGMIKAILALHHRTLPPTINVKKPNPCIDWDSSPLALLTESKPWKDSGRLPRRAGVSAFGFGGTNFHVILQEHVPGLRVVQGKREAAVQIEAPIPTWPKPSNLSVRGDAWVLGAKDPRELIEKIEAILRELSQGTAATLAAGHRRESSSFALRCGFAAEDADGAAKKLSIILEGLKDPKKMAIFPARGIYATEKAGERSRPGVAFLFPGQGSQYPFMLRDLAERFPVVAETFREADEVLTSLGLPAVTSHVFPEIGNGETANRDQADAMKDTQILQPMILTANAAIFRLLGQMGVRPVAAAGHSLGEYAACVAAGVFSFRDAVEAVAVRGREMARVSIADPGLMMSIPADARLVDEVLSEVEGYVVAANKNSPKQTVISGETAAVKKAGELFKARGLDGILLPVSAAFHSGVVAPAREPFMRTLERLTLNPPLVPVLSNVTGDFYPVGPAAPDRIRDLLGKQFAAPVEWVKTLRRLYSEGVRIFLECGPKRVMSNLTLDTLSKDVLALPTNHPKKTGVIQLMETLAALAVEGVPVDFNGADKLPAPAATRPDRKKAELRVVEELRPAPTPVAPAPVAAQKTAPSALDALLDPELRQLAEKKEFDGFLKQQAEPIRSLIKSGFQTYVKTVVPLERTVRQVESQGINFIPVAISGTSAGLPSEVRFPFERESLDDLILGGNFIKKVPENGRLSMLEKNVERLFKGPEGEAELQVVNDLSGVIKLAGYFDGDEFIDEYGLDEGLVKTMDITTRLAVAAGIEALRDAGIPLVRHNRKTSTGHELPDAWALPQSMRQETGVIFASAFPGMASLVDEVTRETAARYGAGAKKRLIEFYTGLVGRIRDDQERERVTKWFTEEFTRMSPTDSEELYRFNRGFLFKVMTMAQGQLAQLIKAQGPNTHVDAACASTTQALLLARDWIRSGHAKRVLVVGADDVAGKTLLPWIGSGFLAMGAATTTGNVSEAALPFDDRRHGLILGSAAVGVVVERDDLVHKRGMEAIATVEGGAMANSAFHGTRLDVDHIASVMEEMIGRWETQTGLSRDDLAKDIFFMSHETYSPKRGGSAAAEMHALRRTFGESVRLIPIANSKGFTGHTMGVGVEDVVALRCLQKGMIPPIPNLRQVDPEFADLNLSRGGRCNASYALRLAAGFGSQIIMALYKVVSREENRIVDLSAHRGWLTEVTGYTDPVVSIEQRTLRVRQRSLEKTEEASPAKVIPLRSQPPVEVPAPVAQAVGAEAIRETILNLLSTKTGYPADMLDTGLDLEADLGIDTVKQAEFISEVRERFDIPRIEGLKIADFPTIEHIITFVLQHTDRSASVSVPAAAPRHADAAVPQASGNSKDDIRETILGLLSAKTGYPADMLDTGLDLEADLGIDTVKQAEFISEVREAFAIPRIEGLKIADFPTIEHIIEFVGTHTQSSEAPEPQAPAASNPTVAAQGGVPEETDVKEKILALLSAKTGYPADMLDTELDLEADLGIDTVKQAEFISEVRELFNIPRIEGLKIADFPTISHIIGFVIDRSKDNAAAPRVEETEHAAAKMPEAEADVRLFEARLVSFSDPDKISPIEVDEVFIAGGPAELADEVEKSLKASGYSSVARVTEPALPPTASGKRVGVINLFPMEQENLPRKTFELCLFLAVTYEQGPAFFVTAVSEDGALGFNNPTADGYKAGVVSGATKSFAREYPDARVRMLDFHPDLAAGLQAELIMRSLIEDFSLETGVDKDGCLNAVRLVPLSEETPEPGTRAGDVVLVSGGAGGITAACIKRLAEQHPLTFFILDRTVVTPRAEQLASFGPGQWEEEKRRIVEGMKRDGITPTPVKVERQLGALRAEAEAYRNIDHLRSLGCEVILRSMDIRDAEAVDRAVQEAGEICGRVDVVIHAAGIDISKALKGKSIEQIENVVSVKVDGMLRLLDSLKRRGLPPRRIVGFGSVSGRFGNLAQIDYSAANDGLAHMLRWASKDMDTKATIIDWAPWSQIGMATRGSVQQTLESAGIDFVAPQQGVEFLFQELGRYSEAPEVMAAGRFGPFAVDAFHVPGAKPVQGKTLAGQQGEVEAIIPGEYLKMRIALDPSHPLLNHHRIDRAAVLPGVGGMEIMRTAASMLNPEAAGASFEEVRFRSPLKIFKDELFEAVVEIVKLSGRTDGTSAYRGRITSWFVDREGRRLGAPRLHHECRVVVGGDSAPSVVEPDRWSQTVWIAEKDIYSVFFHGPAFQFLDSVLVEGAGRGVTFRYRDTAQRESMFSDTIPGAVEAAFQAGAALGVESRGLMALPVGVERVTVHATTSLPCEGRLIPAGDVTQEGPDSRSVFRFNGLITDGEGNPLVSLIGLEMMELQAGTGFPRRVFEELLPVEPTVAEMEGNEERLGEILSDEEAREHADKKVPKRAAEWLAGRVAVKRGVGRLLATRGQTVSGKAVRIVQDDLGKPSALLGDKPRVLVGDLSLSHSNGMVLAAAAAPGEFIGLGVDMEKVEPRSEAWVQDYFTEEEIGEAGTDDGRWARLTRIWSVKEATLKAFGTGLRFDLRDVGVSSPDDSGRAVVVLSNQAARHWEQHGSGSIEARVEEKDGLALARVLIRNGSGH
jgi:acyl transferase domain-containing protein/NAD(P)H-dependent flavin oxidoreductase YrpB (nitropropane dioxygenase family)/NAD(P)-dependent dehydrogenase (short-subunit alcohol dehydrogenase family)/phosphopantetheinyl transferase/acyl carrier protein